MNSIRRQHVVHPHEPRISAVIPAASEEHFIARAADSVRSAHERVIVVNGATDRTEEIARKSGRATTVLSYSERLGYSGARNAGAAVVTGDVIIFLDADSFLDDGALSTIARAWRDGADLGTVRGGPDGKRSLHHFFFFFRNLWHRLGLYHGVLGGCFFIDAKLFRRVGGYSAAAAIDEHYELISRARSAGGKYAFLPSAAAHTSMRRHDAHGIGKVLVFWIEIAWRRRRTTSTAHVSAGARRPWRKVYES